MDTESLAFEAYTNSIHRLRWLFLATLTLSGILLIHSYLEQYSFTESQLIEVLANRVNLGTKENLDQLEKELRQWPNDKKQNNDFKEKLNRYAKNKYNVVFTDNTLNSIKLENMGVPFFGISILGNDFLPIVSLILVMFMLAVSGTLKSLFGPLNLLDLEKNNSRQLAQVYFLFFNDPNSHRQALSKFLMYITIWLPPISLTLAIVLDAWPMLHTSSESSFVIGPSEALIGRYVFLLPIWLATALASLGANSIYGPTQPTTVQDIAETATWPCHP